MTNTIKELEAEIERLKKENELRTGWVSLITHNLKENLGSLLWLIEAVENQTMRQEDFFRLLPQVKLDTKKNLQTTKDTEKWIKSQMTGFQTQQLKLNAFELFSQLRKEFEEKLRGKEITFQFKGDENLSFQTDHFLLLFIFKKILDNAIKYSYPGKEIDFQAVRRNNQVILSIIDSGTGIESPHLESLFTFPSVVFKGTNGEIGAGLSLKIVKSFVYLLNGKIEVHSTENAGTKISVFLP